MNSTRPQLSAADQSKLDALHDRLSRLRRYYVGYPCNEEFDYTELLRFFEFAINNVGDPFGGSNIPLNTHELEREVLADFAEFTHAPKDGWWGYVTSGGTEGNMYGLYVARELFPDGICYFSEECSRASTTASSITPTCARLFASTATCRRSSSQTSGRR